MTIICSASRRTVGGNATCCGIAERLGGKATRCSTPLREETSTATLRPDVVGVGPGQFAEFWTNQSGSRPSRSLMAMTVGVCGSFPIQRPLERGWCSMPDGHPQMRTLRAGEDLYVQHSATQFFGLGSGANGRLTRAVSGPTVTAPWCMIWLQTVPYRFVEETGEHFDF